MIRHIWTVLCRRGITDGDTQNISLIDVLEEVTITQPPSVRERKNKKGVGMVPLEFEAVSLWMREGGEGKNLGGSRITICDSLGTITKSNEVDVDLREYERMRVRHRFSSIPVRGEGQYWLCIEFKYKGGKEWIEVARVPLKVNVEIEGKRKIK